MGSNQWDIKSTNQEPMSSSTKWELCHCFGLKSLIKPMYDFSCYVNIIKVQRKKEKKIGIFIFNCSSCNEFYSCIYGCKCLTWRKGCHSSGINAFLNVAKPLGKTAGRRRCLYHCSRKLCHVTSCTIGSWDQNWGTSEVGLESVRDS